MRQSSIFHGSVFLTYRYGEIQQMQGSNRIGSVFLTSALTDRNPFISTTGCREWLEEQRSQTHVEVQQIPFSALDQWHFLEDTGNLAHRTGKFYSIEGIDVRTNYGDRQHWMQPIINQPEIGILGILAKDFHGVLHFLMQAKIEPGNINKVQLSPTVQATRSNYTRVHQGQGTKYLEYFTDKSKATVLVDQLQSEQGARFLKKRNRNMIVQTNEEVFLHQGFQWLTLGQIRRLMTQDNLVNMDTRTVVSGIPYGSFGTDALEFYNRFAPDKDLVDNYQADMLVSALDEQRSMNSLDDVIHWVTRNKSTYDLDVQRVPLNSVEEWERTDMDIHHISGRYFSIRAFSIEIGNREVTRWTQPLFCAAQEGLIAFLVKKIDGVFHFLVQAKLEAGNFDVIEMAPTVQCLTGNYRQTDRSKWPRFLETALECDQAAIRYNVLQSEEGGRFYHEQNRNMIIEVESRFSTQVPDSFIWMTGHQLKDFIRYNNYLNIQARSLLACGGLL